MTSWQGSSDDRPTGADGALRAVGLAAVCLGIAALAAAAFVLSYQGIRMVALQAGIEPRYATDYPLLIDAMLVIALAAVLALRGAGLPSRMLSWLTLLVVICAAAGAGILHAKGRTLPHNAAVITAAVLPWALVFVAFVLLLAMLRYARLRQRRRAALAEPAWTHPVADGQGGRQQGRAALATPLPVRSPQPWHSVEIVPGFTSQLVSSAAAGAAAGAAAANVEQLVDEDELQQLLPEPAVQTDEAEPQTSEAEPQADEVAPETDEAESQTSEAEPQAGEVAPETDEAESQTSEAEPQTGEVAPETDEAPPAQTAEDDPRADEAQPQADEYDEEDEMPVFHRIWSSPTPPQG